MPTDGWLIGNHSPTADDFAAAFPLEPVDFDALASPPSEQVQAAAPPAMAWDPHGLQLEGLVDAGPVQTVPEAHHTLLAGCRLCLLACMEPSFLIRRRCGTGHVGGPLHTLLRSI